MAYMTRSCTWARLGSQGLNWSIGPDHLRSRLLLERSPGRERSSQLWAERDWTPRKSIRWRGGVAHAAELRHTSVVKTQESSTRDRVARSILENGPSSAHALSERLGLTPAGIRRHLEALLLEGLLSAREPWVTVSNRGRGRPAKVFTLTDRGRERFEHSYDDLAVSALRYLSANGGAEALMGFAQSRALEIERRHAPALANVGAHERLATLADGLSDDGFAASIQLTPVASGHELCQHHCPIAHVAAEFPELCEAETEALGRLLGTHVQRLATIAHGDGVCTTFVPAIRVEKVKRKLSDNRKARA